MIEVGVGVQVHLDMLIAQFLELHHKDNKALPPDLAIGVASSLGRAAAELRLRPRGAPGSQSAANSTFMDELEKRIVFCIDECSAGALAGIDGYYLFKLCKEDTRRVVITRMGELELGLA